MDLSRSLTASGLCDGVAEAGAGYHASGAVLSARPIPGPWAKGLIKGS